MEIELTSQEKYHINHVSDRWNDLLFLQEYTNENLGVNPTSLYEAWELLFPSIYPWIKEEIDKMTHEKIMELIEYQNSENYFPRTSGYNTLSNFSFVIDKVKFYEYKVDIFYDIFDMDFLLREKEREIEKKELYRLYIKNKNLCYDLFKLIKEFI